MKQIKFLLFASLIGLTGIGNQCKSSNNPSINHDGNAVLVENVRDLKAWQKNIKAGRIMPFSFDIGQQPAQFELISTKDSLSQDGWIISTVNYREKNQPLIVVLTCEFSKAMDMVRTELVLKTDGDVTGNIGNIQILDLAVSKHEAVVHGQSGGFWGVELEAFVHGHGDGAVDIDETGQPPKGSVLWTKPVVDDTPIDVDAGNDGRSSNEQLPIWLYAQKDGGFWYGPEWSGCWHMSVHSVDRVRRVQIGLPTFDFRMKEKESITLPTAAFGPYSGSPDDGFNQLRRSIHTHYLPTVDGKKPQPFVYWQGFGGHPQYATEEELYQEVDRAAQVGCEVFCLDGGWNMPATRSDWGDFVGFWNDEIRFPKGVKAFGEYVKSKGMKFGIWMEPRAFKTSPMHKNNPELIYPGSAGLIRLDLPGGVELFKGVFEHFINDYGADWIWIDFNVVPKESWEKVETADRKGLVELGFYQGWYKAVGETLGKYPGLWIETCASGGRIMDLAQLRYGQSIWVADDSGYDNTFRNRTYALNTVLPAVYIQHSILTPQGLMNFLKEKMDSNVPLGSETRFLSYFGGDFGFAQGLPYWREEDIRTAAEYTALYKKYRHYLEGDYYNLLPQPTAWDVWDARQYHDPKSQSGILLVYRLENNKQAEMAIQPLAIGEIDEYNWKVLAGDATVQPNRKSLMVQINEAPGATLIHYQQKNER